MALKRRRQATLLQKLALLLCALLLTFFAGAAYAQEKKGDKADDVNQAQPLLVKALGYAAIYNVEKVGELCRQARANALTPELNAREHWIKALAYGRFEIDYRTESYEEDYKTELMQVRRLKASLYAEELARLDVYRSYYLGGKKDPVKFVEQAKMLYGKATEADPIGASQLAHACDLAALDLEEGNPTRARDFRNQALFNMEKAARAKTDSPEFASFYITYLFVGDRKATAKNMAHEYAQKFTAKPPFMFDRDPYCLYAATVEAKAKDILTQRLQTPGVDASVAFELANIQSKDAAGNPAKVVEIWNDFISKAESGRYPTEGYALLSLASAYYKKAHYQGIAKQWTDCLKTYDQLSALSPHYAQIHHYRAAAYREMARDEKDPAKRAALIKKARQEFETQTQYNFQGRAADQARTAAEEAKAEFKDVWGK
ncbi:MAG: hypothetical protein NTX50_31480 [Candidatus Sumerlaeota bacterium]|nr:hypothetical protein [Candidatus Sumerlaeota bacterium]